MSRTTAQADRDEAALLIHDAGRREVKTLSGQMGAPLSQEAIDWYQRHGTQPDRTVSNR